MRGEQLPNALVSQQLNAFNQFFYYHLYIFITILAVSIVGTLLLHIQI